MPQPNRSDRQPSLTSSPAILAEVLRLSAQPKAGDDDGDKSEQKMPMFWRVFGSTVLSIASVVLVTAYQSLSSNMAEVRNEMSALHNEMRKEFTRLAEGQGDLVKKDECASRLRAVWQSVNELKEDKKDFVALKERCAALVELHRTSEEQRKQLIAELQTLREGRIQHEERRAISGELGVLRERLANLEGKNAISTPIPKDEQP